MRAESHGDFHTTITGERIDLRDLTPPVAHFVARVQERVADRDATPEDVVAIVWSLENPLMQENPAVPGVAFADALTYEHPAFRVMLDLIDRKRLAAGRLDPSAARARYTWSVAQAAETLGAHESTVRRAIHSGRLAAWKDRGSYWLDPDAVKAYQVSTRGQRAREQITVSGGRRSGAQLARAAELGLAPGYLYIREGTEGNFSLRVKGAIKSVHEIRSEKGVVREGLIAPPWRSVAVLRSKKAEDDHRLFILEPRERDDARTDWGLTFAGFYVRGDFRIVHKENNPRRALEAWKSFGEDTAPHEPGRSAT